MRILLYKIIGTSESALTKKCMNVKVQGHFLRSEINSESSFLIKCDIITILSYFWKQLSELKKSKKKMDSPLYFQKWSWPF